MRYPMWKLIPLLGIPGLGCLVLLQVQKDLASGSGTAQAAEEIPTAPEVRLQVQESPTPAQGHMAAVSDPVVENPFAAAEVGGLDFRLAMPTESTAETARPLPLIDTPAAPQPLKQVALADDDPFSGVREAEEDDAAAIQPVKFEQAAERPPADGAAGGSPAERMPAGAADFGPDPFADLAPLAPNPHAAGLEERPAPAPAASPAKLLETEEDPFFDSATAPAAEPKSEPATGSGGGAFESSPAVAPDSAPIEDNPFGDAEPAPMAEPPAQAEPATLEPNAEDPEPAPLEPAKGDVEDPFDFADDGRGAIPSDFETADPPPVERPRPLVEDRTPAAEPASTPQASVRGTQRAEINIEKKAPATATLNEPLVYEIVVTNVGDSPAADVVVSDVVPRGVRLDGTNPQAQAKGDSLVWRFASIAPGQSTTIRIRVVPLEAGSIGSVATVNFSSEVAAQTKVIAPQLTLKVSAPPQVALGQPVDFTFEIANGGSAAAEKVMLHDVLPEGFKHPDGNDLEYEVGTLEPGKSQSVTLRAAAVKPGTYQNTAVITAIGGIKTEAVASVEVASQALSITRQGPKRRYVGRPAMYSNVVKNSSNRPIRGAKVVEQIPAGMDFVSATHNGQFDPDKRTVAWQVGPLGAGQTASLQVVLTATTQGVQDSAVRVEKTEGGQIQLTSSTTVQQNPNLVPSIAGPGGPVTVGERTAFRIRIKNSGNAPATGVTVSFGLPPALKFVVAQGADAQSDVSGGAVARLAEPLAAGAETEILFVVEGRAAGTARIRAQVAASGMLQPLVRDEELVVLAATP